MIQFAYETDSDEWWAGIQVRHTTLLVASLANMSARGSGEIAGVDDVSTAAEADLTLDRLQ